jgi:ribosomal protein S18 acetylase RimI-like enzyme
LKKSSARLRASLGKIFLREFVFMHGATSPAPNYRVRMADADDKDALVRLINVAFAVEKPIIEGDRIDLERLCDLCRTGKFLLLEEDGQLVSCVYVEVKDSSRGYIGLLGVEPGRQKSGLGRRMIEVAEKYLKNAGCEFADLRVVNVRAELQPIYEKLGYSVTGIAPIPDSIPLKIPSYFTVMSKDLR